MHQRAGCRASQRGREPHNGKGWLHHAEPFDQQYQIQDMCAEQKSK
jgi:hypothetical protein